jgi:hypothetical protein
MLRCGTVRTPVALFILALAVRIALLTFPDPAYPDSSYYVDVARSLAAGHGLTVDFVWIFAEVGNHIPTPAVLPVASNAHWLPLASFLQAPFIAAIGPTAFASALPGILIGALVAPLTWLIARDAGARPLVMNAAGAISAVPGAVTVFLAQPENFGLLHVLVAAALWCTARGLKGDTRSFAVAGLLSGLASLARNDGILLAGAIGLVWTLDRIRWWRNGRGHPASSHGEVRRPIPVAAAVGAAVGFLVVMGPWWLRQLATFGSISPTSSNGAALWIRTISEWNSITANPSLATFLAQGPGPILASRLAGLSSAVGNFAVLICSVVLVPFVVIGALHRRRSPDFRPWFVYTAVVFAGATLLYPLHVPGGAFIHTAIGLAPHAAILGVEGILVLVSWLSSRRRRWDESRAGSIFVWGMVAIVAAIAVAFALPVQHQWDTVRQPRAALAASLDGLGVTAEDRIFSIDAAGLTYWTGRPGVVTTNDSLATEEAIARAYGLRWLVLERAETATSMGPVLAGNRPPWVGPPAFVVPSSDGGDPQLALYPICLDAAVQRCAAK